MVELPVAREGDCVMMSELALFDEVLSSYHGIHGDLVGFHHEEDALLIYTCNPVS